MLSRNNQRVSSGCYQWIDVHMVQCGIMISSVLDMDMSMLKSWIHHDVLINHVYHIYRYKNRRNYLVDKNSII